MYLRCHSPGPNGRRKLAFAFKKDAEKAGRDLAKKWGQKYRVYQCPNCKHWHLTTETKGKPMSSAIAKPANAEATTLRLLRMDVEDFMRIPVMHLDAQGRHVVISGPNGSGKTSALDAIWAALGGKTAREMPEPIRRGADKATVRLDLGEYIVTRTWTEKGGSVIVTGADGSRKNKPQQLLDGLWGKFALDPIAFLERRPQDQVDDVLSFAGVEPPLVRVEEITGEKEMPRPGESADAYLMRLSADETGLYYLRRREATRVMERKRSAVTEQHNTIQALGGPLKPDEQETGAAELVEHIQAAQSEQEKYREAQQAVAEAVREHATCSRKLEELTNQRKAMAKRLSDLEAEVKAVREALDVMDGRLQKGEAARKGIEDDQAGLTRNLLAMQDPALHIAELKAKLAAVGQTNEKLTKRRLAADQLARLAAENEQAEAEHQRLETILAQLRHLRVHLLDGVDLGVPGLEVGQGELRLDGVSFRQASRAQRLRTAVAVAALQNPKLRVLRVDDAEHLDSEGVRLLYEIAEQRDFQVLMARVTDGPEAKVEFVEGAA